MLIRGMRKLIWGESLKLVFQNGEVAYVVLFPGR